MCYLLPLGQSYDCHNTNAASLKNIDIIDLKLTTTNITVTSHECNGVPYTSSLTLYSPDFSRRQQRKYQSSVLPALCEGINWRPLDSPWQRVGDAQRISMWWCYHKTQSWTVCTSPGIMCRFLSSYAWRNHAHLSGSVMICLLCSGLLGHCLQKENNGRETVDSALTLGNSTPQSLIMADSNGDYFHSVYVCLAKYSQVPL